MYHLNMKRQGVPSHDISSNKCYPFSFLLTSSLEELYLDSSWEVAYLQLELELELDLVAVSLVASHSSASSSSMGMI